MVHPTSQHPRLSDIGHFKGVLEKNNKLYGCCFYHLIMSVEKKYFCKYVIFFLITSGQFCYFPKTLILQCYKTFYTILKHLFSITILLYIFKVTFPHLFKTTFLLK